MEAEAGDGGARIADATAITEPLGDGPPLTFAGAVAITEPLGDGPPLTEPLTFAGAEPLGDVSPQTPQTARGLAMSDAQSFLSGYGLLAFFMLKIAFPSFGLCRDLTA